MMKQVPSPPAADGGPVDVVARRRPARNGTRRREDEAAHFPIGFPTFAPESLAAGNIQKQLIEAQERERKRVAREIHDEASQALAAALFALDLACAQLPKSAQQSLDLLKESRQYLETCAHNLHQIAANLRPPILEQLGLFAAGRWLIRQGNHQSGLEITFTTQGNDESLSEEVKITVFRILQEALTNMRKHANASQVGVQISVYRRCLKLVVQDNGTGFCPQQLLDASTARPTLGLVGMRERASLVNGELHVSSSPGRGTTIHLAIPLKREGRPS